MSGTYLKAPHKRGCDGDLYNTTLHGRKQLVHVDKAGRIGNGGIIAHDYRCNKAYDGCKARVLVLERAVRLLAVAAERRAS